MAECEKVDVAGECARDAEYFVQPDMSPGSKECKMHAFEVVGTFLGDGYSILYIEKLNEFGMTAQEYKEAIDEEYATGVLGG